MGIGGRLRQLREERALTVREIAGRTRIAPSVLRAIERDDFDAVPSGIYVRGYLRAYAKELKLDSEEVVRRYLSEHPPLEDPTPGSSDPGSWVAAQASHASLPTPYATIGLSLLVLVSAYSWWQAAQDPSAQSPEVAPAVVEQGVLPAPTDLETPERVRSADEAVSSLAEAPPVQPPDLIRLALLATGNVWVAASADGERVLFRLLGPDERVSLTATKQLTVRVGDAGAVLVSLNGDDPVLAGGSGQVRDLSFTRNSEGITLQ